MQNLPLPAIAVCSLVLTLLTSATQAATMPEPQHLLALIRTRFRSHRPPPPYVTYTLVREQLTDEGYPDYVDSYTYHVWCRTLDRAALGRRVFRDRYRGQLEFLRPAFNEPRDPGPPSADIFEPAPDRPHPISFVPTPEALATGLSVIASVAVRAEFDYRVASVKAEGDQLHLRLEPIRDPQRNRLRDIWADKTTYELRKLIATDKLFVEKGSMYGVAFTITMGMLEGRPVVTDIHGDVGDGYFGDGRKVDFHFRDIAFPASLPSWYFTPDSYAGHMREAPL
jgi:hypothetical protein